MHNHSELCKRLCLGAVSGLFGTVAIQALMGATKKWLPQAMPPMKQEPGEFMVEQVEELLPNRVSEHIPETVEKAAATGLGLGYGVAFGALYSAVRPKAGSLLIDGTVLGLGCWAAGYIGWLPALGLMPPVTDQTAPQVAGPVVDHIAYGIATVASYAALTSQFDPVVPAEGDFGPENRISASAVI